MLGDVLREGARPGLARLLPSSGTSAWGWLNAFSAGLALCVGVLAAGVWVVRRVVSKSGDSEE